MLRTKVVLNFATPFTRRVIALVASHQMYRARQRGAWHPTISIETLYRFTDRSGATSGEKMAKKKAGCS